MGSASDGSAFFSPKPPEGSPECGISALAIDLIGGLALAIAGRFEAVILRPVRNETIQSQDKAD